MVQRLFCSLGLKLDGEWIWRCDGAGDTNYEADKGAMSDSLKRAELLGVLVDTFMISKTLMFLVR